MQHRFLKYFVKYQRLSSSSNLSSFIYFYRGILLNAWLFCSYNNAYDSMRSSVVSVISPSKRTASQPTIRPFQRAANQAESTVTDDWQHDYTNEPETTFPFVWWDFRYWPCSHGVEPKNSQHKSIKPIINVYWIVAMEPFESARARDLTCITDHWLSEVHGIGRMLGWPPKLRRKQ